MPNQPTTLANGRLEWAADVLRTIGVANPSREIREIMASVLAVPRDEVWGLRDRIEHARISEAFAVAVERRRDGEPLEYVTGRCGFRHKSTRPGRPLRQSKAGSRPSISSAQNRSN